MAFTWSTYDFRFVKAVGFCFILMLVQHFCLSTVVDGKWALHVISLESSAGGFMPGETEC